MGVAAAGARRTGVRAGGAVIGCAGADSSRAVVAASGWGSFAADLGLPSSASGRAGSASAGARGISAIATTSRWLRSAGTGSRPSSSTLRSCSRSSTGSVRAWAAKCAESSRISVSLRLDRRSITVRTATACSAKYAIIDARTAAFFGLMISSCRARKSSSRRRSER
ncbi:MAG: hypothetical protein AMJ64_02270 [Betaproteobacteria bacterium SG8_39]|nr:MAG: hypothetical protein AMJ64_02270 [Betaproteobacteria bacterium SG8_39]